MYHRIFLPVTVTDVVILPSWEIGNRNTSQNRKLLCLLEIVHFSEVKVIFSYLALHNLNVAYKVVVSISM